MPLGLNKPGFRSEAFMVRFVFRVEKVPGIPGRFA